jgi:hypothetical protein
MAESRSISALTGEILVALARGIMELRRHADADRVVLRELAGAIDAMADLLVLNRAMLEAIRDLLQRCSADDGGEIDAEMVARLKGLVRRIEGERLT